MRKKNWPAVYVGIIFIVLAIAFFFYMLHIAPTSNNPKGLMEVVGECSGVVGAIGVIMIVTGYIVGKKVA